MKKVMLLACAVAAAMMTGQESAQAQCRGGGFGGGFGGVSYGNSFGYSSFSPRSSFSIGFTSAPRISYQRSAYRGSVGRNSFGHHPSSIYGYRGHYGVQPRYNSVYRSRYRGW